MEYQNPGDQSYPTDGIHTPAKRDEREYQQPRNQSYQPATCTLQQKEMKGNINTPETKVINLTASTLQQEEMKESTKNQTEVTSLAAFRQGIIMINLNSMKACT
jgi:hypothetical protein